MTIHAGEKAARLRRATTSAYHGGGIGGGGGSSGPSSTVPINVLSGGESQGEQALGTRPSGGPSSLLSRRSSSLSPRSTSLPTMQRQRTRGKQQGHSTCMASDLHSASGQFVFPGIDHHPIPTPDQGYTNLDWDRFNVHGSPLATNDEPGNVSTLTPTLIFVRRPTKDAEPEPTMPKADAAKVNDNPRSSGDVVSPRQFLPWFLTLTTSPPQTTKQETEAEDGQPVERSAKAEGRGGEQRKKHCKKKNKTKRKSTNGKTKAVEERNEAATDAVNGSESSTTQAHGHPSEYLQDEGTEAEDYVLVSAVPSLPGAIEGFAVTGDGDVTRESAGKSGTGLLTEWTERESGVALNELQGQIVPAPQPVLAPPSMRSNDGGTQAGAVSLATSSSTSNSSSVSMQGASRNKRRRDTMKRARRETQRIAEAIERAEKEKVAVYSGFKALSVQTGAGQHSLQVCHSRNISKTETETSYHTAPALASPSLVEGCKQKEPDEDEVQASPPKLCRGGADEEAIDRPNSSSGSLHTEPSALSTEEAKTPSQEAPTMLGREGKRERKVEDGEEGKRWATSARPSLTIHSHSGRLSGTEVGQERSSSQKDSLCADDMVSSPGCKAGEGHLEREASSDKVERLQRTLDWRLVSALGNSSAPHLASSAWPQCQGMDMHRKDKVEDGKQARDELSEAFGEAVPRSEVPLQVRRQQQRGKKYGWVSLLPSFEEHHARRSYERETQLRKLAWLGLEEYAARKLRISSDGGTAETVVWITHSSYSRSATPCRSSASPLEPMLYSSSLWLKSASKGKRVQGDRRTGDGVRAYRLYLGQTRAEEQVLLQKMPMTTTLAIQPSLMPFRADRVANGSDKNRLQWPSSPRPSSEHHEFNLSSAATPYPSPAIVLESNGAGEGPPSRESSLELQRNIEQCMYQLHCPATSKSGPDTAWLNQLKGIEEGEKEAIEAFLTTSSADWYHSMDSPSDLQSNYTRHACHEAYVEPVWPMTPYTPLSAGQARASIALVGEGEMEGNEAEGLDLSNGLSSREMAEIEDAMYRDYLNQANQGGTTSRSRRKERSNSHLNSGRGGSGGGGGGNRTRGQGQCHRLSGVELPARASHLLSPTAKTRPHEAKCAGKAAASGGKGNRTNASSKSEWPAPEHLPQLSRPRAATGVEQKVNEARAISIMTTQQRQDSGGVAALAPPQTAKGADTAGTEDVWTRETEDRAVRHSLASLQEHLSLVAAQKQRQEGGSREEGEKMGYEEERQRQLLQHHSSQVHHQLGDYLDWQHESLAQTTAAQLQSQRMLQAQMQRQQQQCQEATYLEQRHLDSYSQAMERSSSYASHAYFGAEEATNNVARLHAALMSEWARHGGGLDVGQQAEWYSNLEGVRQHPHHYQHLHQQMPAITLTEPTPPRMAESRPDEGFRQAAGRNQHLEDALSHQAQQAYLVWQRGAAVSASGWDQSAESVTAAVAEAVPTLRRHSVQSTGSRESSGEYGSAVEEASSSSSLSTLPGPRTGSFVVNHSRPPRRGSPAYGSSNVGSRRKGKQREAAIQRAMELASQKQRQQPLGLHGVPTMPAGDREREHRQQAYARHAPAHVLSHSYDGDYKRHNHSHSPHTLTTQKITRG